MKRLSAFTLIIFYALISFSACGDSAQKTERKTDGTVTEKHASQKEYDVEEIRLQGGDVGYLTPFAHYPRGPGGYKTVLIFDNLLERDEKGLIPWLAESWKIEDNGLAYRFILRKGVLWQDGQPFTAEDAAPSSAGIKGLDAPKLMELLKRQAVEIDVDKRRLLIGEIQRQAAELVPEIPLFYTAGYTVFKPSKYDGWMNMFDHHSLSHSKLSYLERTGPAAMRNGGAYGTR